MFETSDEISALQRLLDASHASATQHLRKIINDERTLTVRDLIALLTGMKVLSIATVTAGGEPRISAVDGHFLHGTWAFSTSGTAAKALHMQARPTVSVAHIDNEKLAAFSHGRVEQMVESDADWTPTLDHWTAHYESSPLSWAENVRLYRYRPHWMVGYAWKPSELLAERGVEPQPSLPRSSWTRRRA